MRSTARVELVVSYGSYPTEPLGAMAQLARAIEGGDPSWRMRESSGHANGLFPLAELADKRSQNIWLWQESGPETSELTHFSYVRQVLFDEHDFDRPACVGETLYVEDEREALLELMDVLYSIRPIGDESNEQLLTHRKWPKVVEAARKAHAVLTEEDNKRRKS